MIKKILIANRGEIACRVIRTAKAMNIATVAVYSDADRDALHVEMADEAVRLGPAPASQSYLLADKVIEACKSSGADAVHPGYGFLSENAGFAKALEKEGIIFIGPNVTAIEVMGDKIESKKFADKAKVNTVPGYLGEIGDGKEAVKIAKDVGFPVMIKASAGGGGKGMRIARSVEEVEEGFALARSEAKSSFGDDRIFIEKFVENPRHIEIQVLADSHGNTVYLGERECSIQRRNQKVVEEAPSSFLDEKTRAKMGEQAVALAKAVQYRSAGTVEFIVDPDRNFYFLEMNTRLQVEHPVTELITGIDLVEQMIRVAAGEKLPITQDDVELSGWAIESRIYAEDPYRNFLPSTGRLVRYAPPEEGIWNGLTIRNDTGVVEGGEISVFYDPMIAKLVTHGPDRESATKHMVQALDAFHIDGIRHNIPFLAAVMAHPRWISGNISTAFIDDEFPDGFDGLQPDKNDIRTLASVAATIDHLSNTRRREISHQMDGQFVFFADERVVVMGETRLQVTVNRETDVVLVTFEDDDEDVEVISEWHPGQAVWTGTINAEPYAVQVRPILNGYRLVHRGIQVDAFVYTVREAELQALMPARVLADTSGLLLCPMPGTIVSIAVKEGQEVKVGETLCVVEAMKMENVLRAERDGTIAKINPQPGDNLAVDDIILEFEQSD
ncbi:MAG: acetyl/propionyl/methylcrotonyl-CoA carboxylase subunit alpha, partial [Fimbriimonadaceae bacterium]|nr:acetyl/propionyl/methylcrotonyl-CoA carboxylase subunit alpha [Alphaproteobacteria bacterium]